MATVKQKKLAKLIVENATLDKPLNAGQMLEKVSYGKISKQPSRVLESAGVKEELEVLGFTEEAAMKVVEEIMNNQDVDPSARLKATDQVFKVRGTYAPEKKLIANLNVNEAKRNKTNGLLDSILGN
jgi:hypothetical protein